MREQTRRVRNNAREEMRETEIIGLREREIGKLTAGKERKEPA